MNVLKISALVVAGFSLTACSDRNGADRSFDSGIDRKHLSQLVAGIWVDPNGCDHWMIDDGLEGYLSERLTPDGRPVCSGVAPPNTVVGPFRSGTTLGDPL
jgi:hypothetical protein